MSARNADLFAPVDNALRRIVAAAAVARARGDESAVYQLLAEWRRIHSGLRHIARYLIRIHAFLEPGESDSTVTFRTLARRAAAAGDPEAAAALEHLAKLVYRPPTGGGGAVA